MKQFRKRIFNSIYDFSQQAIFLVTKPGMFRKMIAGEQLSKSFLERLMLSVIAVNKCRYCSYYHTRVALSVGLTSSEITQLLDGETTFVANEQRPALLFAHHWAENNGKVDQPVIKTMIDVYGPEQFSLIEFALKTIRFGNLLGNLIDYFLFRISFGKWGNG